jgi:GNAT superfamily N-acetyltransferase
VFVSQLPPSPRIVVNLQLAPHDVPDLREAVGWDRHDWAYPQLLDRVLFWAGARAEAGELIAFAYVAGTGLPHGYLEDVMVHPVWQRRGLGVALVKALLREAARTNVSRTARSTAPSTRRAASDGVPAASGPPAPDDECGGVQCS